MRNYYYDLPDDIKNYIQDIIEEERIIECKINWIYDIISMNEYFKEIKIIIDLGFEEENIRSYRSIEKYLLETGWAGDDNYSTVEQDELKHRIYGVELYYRH